MPVKLQVPKRGDEIYANFRAPLHTWVLFNAESCCKPLLRALGEVSGIYMSCRRSHTVPALQLLNNKPDAVLSSVGDTNDPAHRVSELLVSGTLEALQRASVKSGPDIRLGCLDHATDLVYPDQFRLRNWLLAAACHMQPYPNDKCTCFYLQVVPTSTASAATAAGTTAAQR